MRGSCCIFVIIGCAVTTALTSIENDFEIETSKLAFISKYDWEQKMIEIQRRYKCISLVVNRLHSKFEWIFMSQVTYAFLLAISATSFFFNLESRTSVIRFLTLTVWIIEPIVRLVLITYTVDRIKTKVKLEALTVNHVPNSKDDSFSFTDDGSYANY